jgi:hypothetical protein
MGADWEIGVPSELGSTTERRFGVSRASVGFAGIAHCASCATFCSAIFASRFLPASALAAAFRASSSVLPRRVVRRHGVPQFAVCEGPAPAARFDCVPCHGRSPQGLKPIYCEFVMSDLKLRPPKKLLHSGAEARTP